MFTPLKTFAGIFLAISLLGLADCSKIECGDDFVCLLETDYQNGVSYKGITKKIMFEEYVDIPNLADEILAQYDFDEMDREYKDYEMRMFLFVKNIQEGNCEEVWKYLKQRAPVTWYSENELMGIFYQQGICVEKDPIKAAEIYLEIIDEGVRSSRSAARLGSMYWKGEDVSKNDTRTKNLFQKAVLWEASAFFGEGMDDPFFDATDTIDYKIWGLTIRQMWMAFALTETGPWELPEPLIEKIRWLESLEKNNGEELVGISKNLLEGKGEYDQDIETALALMINAGEYFNNQEAKYLAPLWGMDKDICAQRMVLNPFLDCDWEFSYSFSHMEEAAFEGNKNAIRYLIDYFTNHPERNWAGWSLYQYLLLAGNYGMEINSEILVTAKGTLSTFEIELIKTWIEKDYNWPITNDLPQ